MIGRDTRPSRLAAQLRTAPDGPDHSEESHGGEWRSTWCGGEAHASRSPSQRDRGRRAGLGVGHTPEWGVAHRRPTESLGKRGILSHTGYYRTGYGARIWALVAQVRDAHERLGSWGTGRRAAWGTRRASVWCPDSLSCPVGMPDADGWGTSGSALDAALVSPWPVVECACSTTGRARKGARNVAGTRGGCSGVVSVGQEPPSQEQGRPQPGRSHPSREAQKCLAWPRGA